MQSQIIDNICKQIQQMIAAAQEDNRNTSAFAQSYFIPTTKTKFSLLDSRPYTKSNAPFPPPRPKSMLAHRKHYATLNTHTQSKPIPTANFFQKVEGQLEARLKSELSSYLRSKLRQFVNKTHHTKTVKQFLHTTLDQNTQTTPKLQTPKPKYLFDPKPKKALSLKAQHPYLTNAKQRITRLVDRKIQREAHYSEMSNNIRERCLSHERQRIRNHNTLSPERTIGNEEWDQRWCQEQQLQAKRYRKRLMQKFKKSNPETMPFND